MEAVACLLLVVLSVPVVVTIDNYLILLLIIAGKIKMSDKAAIDVTFMTKK